MSIPTAPNVRASVAPPCGSPALREAAREAMQYIAERVVAELYVGEAVPLRDAIATCVCDEGWGWRRISQEAHEEWRHQVAAEIRSAMCASLGCWNLPWHVTVRVDCTAEPCLHVHVTRCDGGES